ncbi:hypothetical protein N431DRAFT_321297 [Stipitochalara longipes BDJ]|nr:hypothetical protein N431DRAFT_321297 [Stipitochalara longipes BDJ]
MEPPLQVAADGKGIFRDTLDRPMIMVFKSIKNHAQDIKKVSSASEINTSDTKPPLMFVPVAGSKKEDRLDRSKIRAHVMHDHFRRKQEKKTIRKRPHNNSPSQESIRASAVTSNDQIEICPLGLQPTASLDPFAQYPIDMKPRIYLLAHHYITIIVPSAQPSDFGWAESFTDGLSDPALFHVILLCAAVHLNFVAKNNFTSAEIAYHKVKAIQSVNERLRHSPTAASDHIIHAVMLMALNEARDFSAAKAHLNGLDRMIEIRGGFATLDHALQQKICFTDYLCCVEPDEKPRFRFPVPIKSPCLEKFAGSDIEVPVGFEDILPLVTLDQEFLDIIVDVEAFCMHFRQAEQSDIKKKLGPHDYNVTALRYRLLCMENARKSNTHKELVGDVCRIGTLIFIKTVFDQLGCWGPSHRVWGRPYKFLVEKLRVYLTRLDSSVDASRTEFLELLLWVNFVGGVLQLEYHNRIWYNSRIAITAAKLGLTCFDEVKKILSKFLYIEWVHNKPCRELWEDVQGVSDPSKVALPEWGIAA